MTNTGAIAVALALDAFAVALGIGCGSNVRLKEKLLIVFSFGFFQGLFAFIGAYLGKYIDSNLFNIGNYLGGIIVLVIGILFLKEGFENKESCVNINFKAMTYIVLGISVSIDALGVGFSVLYDLKLVTLINTGVSIALITSLLTLSSLILVNYVKHFGSFEKYANYLGGVILVLFGINMMFGIL